MVVICMGWFQLIDTKYNDDKDILNTLYDYCQS